MEVQAKAPVVKVPVLSKAMVLHLTKASSTFPPCIRMPLQASKPCGVRAHTRVLLHNAVKLCNPDAETLRAEPL